MNDNLSREDVEALHNTKDGHKGCGTPQPITQRLSSEGYIEIVVEDETRGIWRPQLTHRGKKAIQ